MRDFPYPTHPSIAGTILVLLLIPNALGAELLYEPGELLIKFSPTATTTERAQLLNRIDGSIVDRLDRIDVDLIRLNGTTVEAALTLLQGNPAVAYAEPNYRGALVATPDDPLFSDAWHLENVGQAGGTPGADIDAVGAWEFISSSSPTLLVAVFDTGINYEHEDMQDNIWTNPGEIPGNQVDDDGNGYVDDVHGYDFFGDDDSDPLDTHDHGTSTSSTLAAVGNNTIGVTGVAWGASVVAVRVTDGSDINIFDISQAIQYAIDIGVKITSHSYFHFGGFSQTIYNLIGDACEAGQLFVAAAGNRGLDNDGSSPTYPASYDHPCIISVGMTDRDDEFAGLGNACSNGSTSNFGATTVDLAAPGCEICRATWVQGEYSCGVGSSSGTSLATPQVAGAAALVWTQNPTWTSQQVKDRILAQVDVLPSLQGKMVSEGRLNLEKSLDNVSPSAISDLTIESLGRNSAAVSWTASGDDGNSGTSEAFDLRYSPSPITEANFYEATEYPWEPTPGPSGTYHCVEIDGLNTCATYYFAIKSKDNAVNISDLSNVPAGQTRCTGFTVALCDGFGLLAQGWEEKGWVPDNSLFWETKGSRDTDFHGVQSKVGPVDGSYRARLVKVGSGKAELDEVRLGAVDYETGELAVTGPDRAFLGAASAVDAVIDDAGADVTNSVDGSSDVPYRGEPGQSLTVTVGTTASHTALIIESAGYEPGVSADSTGILIQEPDGSSWKTLEQIHPRRRFAQRAVETKGHGELRLLFLGEHSIRLIQRLAVNRTDNPEWLTLEVADHSRLGDVKDAVSSNGGTSTTLGIDEALVLEFGSTEVPTGKTRSFFLEVEGAYTSLNFSAARTFDIQPAQPGHRFALGPARPNPTTGPVKISYTLDQGTDVSIRVYDLSGRLVRTLVSGPREVGRHELIWDARDDGGRRVGAGVYFYKMVAGDWRSQQKVVFLNR